MVKIVVINILEPMPLYLTWILTLLSVTGEWSMLFVQSGFPRVRWVATTGSGRATVQHHSLTEAVKYVHHILGNNRIETWKAKSLAKSRGKDETKMAAFSSPLLWMGQETWFSILFLLWVWILKKYVFLCLALTVVSWPAHGLLRRQIRWSGIPISLRIFHIYDLHSQRL